MSGESKIKFSEYSLGIVKAWVSSGAISEPLAQRLMKDATEYIQDIIVCNGCLSALPSGDFYKQKVQFGNRGRSKLCKKCWKDRYGVMKK